MNKATLSLAAAMMLSAAPLSVTAVHAQDRDKEAPSMKQGGGGDGPSSRDRDSGKSGGGEKSSDRGPSSERSSKGADKSAADSPKGEAKEKSADRGEKSSNRQSEERGEKSERKHSEDRGDKPSSKQSEERSKEPSSKKADSDTEKKSRDAADAKKNDDAKRNADADEDRDRDRSRADSGKSDTKQSASESEKTEKAKSADLSGDKKDRVKTSFKSENVKEITNVNVDISVGRRLPRDWDYRPVPQAVIAIVPEYSGYRYAYVEDRYVIVDPDTYEVVYAFDESGGGGSASVGRSTGEAGSDRCSANLVLTEEDRTYVFEKVHTQSSSVKIGNLEIGVELPGDTRVETFPSEVTTRVGKLDGCRYVVVDDRVAVIDPTDEKIVAVIER